MGSIRSSSSERGAVVIIVSFLSLALLAVAGLVIDFSTIARGLMQMQKAADAGVLAGLAYRINNRQMVDPAASVEHRAEQYALENLKQLGIRPEKVKIVPRFQLEEPSTMQEALTVEVQYDAPLFLIPFLPLEVLSAGDIPGTKKVEAVAKGVLPPSNIVLVLDTSNSMACPNSGVCPCQFAGEVCELNPSGSAKIYDLRRGVYSFLKQFRQGYDRIALVSYDVVAQTVVPFRVEGFSMAEFEYHLGKDGNVIPDANFLPGGMTNPSDGLSEAFQELKQKNFLDSSGRAREPISIVFFTDGNPTAVDGCFSDIVEGPEFPVSVSQQLDAQLPVLCPPGSRRYTQFEVEWVNTVDGVEQRLRGPSPLVDKTEILKIPKVERSPDRILNSASEQSIPACSTLSPVEQESELAVAVLESLGGCVNSLEYELPDNNSENNGAALKDYKALYYHRVASIADFLRSKNFLIYGIGIGESAKVLPVEDVYQDQSDDFFRKDALLISITGHSDLAQIELFNHDTGEYADFPFQGWETWEQRVAQKRAGNGRDGYYLQDSDPKKVESMFSEVARRIQLRITQ